MLCSTDITEGTVATDPNVEGHDIFDRIGITIGLVLLALFPAGVLWLDGIVCWSVAKQLHSLSYEKAPGIVTKSEMRVLGASRDLALEYSYEVDGVGYTNNRLGYFVESGRQEVKMVEDYAVENAIVVYYNPADPQDSVLVRGLSEMDVSPPLALTMINVLLFVLAYPAGSGMFGWLCRRPIEIKVWRRDVVWFAEVYDLQPIEAGALAALVLSWILGFVVKLSQLVFPAWMLSPLSTSALFMVVLGSLYTYVKTGPTVQLEVDEIHRRLTLRIPEEIDPETTNFASIQSIDACSETVVVATESRVFKLLCANASHAAWLRNWLCERCRGSACVAYG
jgi:hypothetical protein